MPDNKSIVEQLVKDFDQLVKNNSEDFERRYPADLLNLFLHLKKWVYPSLSKDDVEADIENCKLDICLSGLSREIEAINKYNILSELDDFVKRNITKEIDYIIYFVVMPKNEKFPYRDFEGKVLKPINEIFSAKDSLDPHQSFENYIKDTTSNLYAYNICTKIASQLQSAPGVYGIIGPPGVGKTHLVSAVINSFRGENGGLKIYFIHRGYLTSLMRQFNNYDKFKATLIDADLVVFDDLTMILGIETAFFLLGLKEVVDGRKNKVTLYTSNYAPSEIKIKCHKKTTEQQGFYDVFEEESVPDSQLIYKTPIQPFKSRLSHTITEIHKPSVEAKTKYLKMLIMKEGGINFGELDKDAYAVFNRICTLLPNDFRYIPDTKNKILIDITEEGIYAGLKQTLYNMKGFVPSTEDLLSGDTDPIVKEANDIYKIGESAFSEKGYKLAKEFYELIESDKSTRVRCQYTLFCKAATAAILQGVYNYNITQIGEVFGNARSNMSKIIKKLNDTDLDPNINPDYKLYKEVYDKMLEFSGGVK